MKRFIIVLALLLPYCFLFSQGQIEKELLNVLEKTKGNEYVNINIYFHDKEDLSAVNEILCQKKASFDERVKMTTNFRKNNFSFAKDKFYEEIESILGKNNISKNIKNEKDFWVANMLNVDAKADVIKYLIRISNIRSIDVNSRRYKIAEAQKSLVNNVKSVGGTEWGLKKINADKLWALGYTGKNLIFMSVDTGVEVEHPAISENYAGNYLPMEQCWYGIRNDEPTEYGNHGTHTTGTVLGLDRATQDTIGVAYNSKFIASDPIATTNEDLLNPAEILGVYQWALDPDGNPETTRDVPRAINNSWGFAHSDLNYLGGFDPCAIPEANVLVTLETAGICVPFSAGNEGPGDTTIGYPAVKVFNEVNPMSIGAISNNEIIASFSSRGPAPDSCIDVPQTPSIIIKPEVVAPGVEVRSCVGRDSYEYYQGTSMACPHVVGALLLLAEAFPNASAYELKNALYQTARDLGEVAEDNYYGNGLIDVEAAYNYLSMTYSPTPPISNDYDLETKISLNNNYLCLSNLNFIYAKIKNLGINPIQDFNVKTYLNNTLVDSVVINQNLLNNEEYSYSFDLLSIDFPLNEIKSIFITVSPIFENLEDEFSENDIFNNGDCVQIKIIPEENFPYSNNFEDISDISELPVYIENHDNSNTWTVMNWGTNNEHKAIGVVFKNYYNSGAIDRIYFPEVELPNIEDSLFLIVKYAYKDVGTYTLNDSLFIDVSNNCGDSFTNIYKNGGKTLSTVISSSSSGYYNPTESDFKTLKLDISDYKGSKLMCRLSTKNDKSTTIFVDSIAITNIWEETSIEDYYKNKIKIYPNPFTNIINIENDLENEIIEIYDNLGKLIKREIINNNHTIDCSSYSKGIYSIKFIKHNITKKIVKE